MTHAEYVKFARIAGSLALLRRPRGIARPELLLTTFEVGFALVAMRPMAIDLAPDAQADAGMYPHLAPVVDGKTPDQVRRDAGEAVAELRPVIEARLSEMEQAQTEGITERPAGVRERAALKKARETLDWLEAAF